MTLHLSELSVLMLEYCFDNEPKEKTKGCKQGHTEMIIHKSNSRIVMIVHMKKINKVA